MKAEGEYLSGTFARRADPDALYTVSAIADLPWLAGRRHIARRAGGHDRAACSPGAAVVALCGASSARFSLAPLGSALGTDSRRTLKPTRDGTTLRRPRRDCRFASRTRCASADRPACAAGDSTSRRTAPIGLVSAGGIPTEPRRCEDIDRAGPFRGGSPWSGGQNAGRRNAPPRGGLTLNPWDSHNRRATLHHTTAVFSEYLASPPAAPVLDIASRRPGRPPSGA